MTQTERVLAELRAAGLAGRCSSWFYANALPHARNRISVELKRQGYCIVSAPCGDDHGDTHFNRYTLLHGPERTCPTCRAERQLALFPQAVAG